MLQSNREASAIFSRHGITACTDVTGFGLAGHLLEMLDASRASARLNAAKVPLYVGFGNVVAQGTVSTLHRDNAKVACRVHGVQAEQAWLYDPQTSGGLLAGVKPSEAQEVLRSLIDAGCAESAIIGEVVAGEPEIVAGEPEIEVV